jgi:hypothetical protein
LREKLTVITFVVAILLISSPVSGQIFSPIDTLRISDAQGDPGDTLSIGFDLVNTFGVGGISIRVEFDSTVFEADTVFNTARLNMFEASLINNTNPGVLVYLTYSWNPFENYLPVGSGDISILNLIIQDDAPDGVYNISFENDSIPPLYDTALSDSSGGLYVVPILGNATLIVGDPNEIEEVSYAPHQFELLQNYPNPFNMHTQISFVLEEKSDVSLEIFDLLGRKVANVFSGKAEAGKTIVNWDGRSDDNEELASGIYYYKVLISDNRSITKRMTLIK